MPCPQKLNTLLLPGDLASGSSLWSFTDVNTILPEA